MWLDLHTGREVILFNLKTNTEIKDVTRESLFISNMSQIQLCLQALIIITLTYLDSKLNHYYSSCT